jgi:drug/metabolite transporter (DMT)-like permease
MTARTQLALGMAVFGSATPVSKIVTGAMPVFVGSALRVGLGALVLAPFVAGSRDQVKRLGRRDWVLIGLIALFGMFGFSALMLYGMRMVTGVVGAVVMSTAPAVTAAASMLFMGDRPTLAEALRDYARGGRRADPPPRPGRQRLRLAIR